MDDLTMCGSHFDDLTIRKAFDTLEWLFLLKALTTYGFCEKFVGWVHRILLSARLSIKLNGVAHGLSVVKEV